MDDNKKNGPEWQPLREYVKSFKIKVTVVTMSDVAIRTEVMDFGNRDDKVWLSRLCYWAWSNGHYVETEAFK